jgi:hypothetical protein
MAGWRDVIVSLNSLGVGDLDQIRSKLASAADAARSLGSEELAERIGEAAAALQQGRTAEYRRLLSLVVSRMGHLKD